MRISKALPLMMALAAACSCAQAAPGFTTIQRAETDLDDTTPLLLVSFNLPDTIATAPSTANSAVLDMDILGSQFFFNRAYINPPQTTCSSNQGDPNAAAAIGYLQAHADINMKNEWAVNHITLSSALLRPGANQLLICIRDNTGHAGEGVQNLDAIGVRNVTLQFHTAAH